MSVIAWDRVGERFFETGVDRGVLYPVVGDGVPWNGLIAVNHTPSGGSARPFYIDGYKYQNRSSAEEFEADIQAYTYPEEFETCGGLVSIGNGLSMGYQRRRSFGLSYRTKIGNDVNGDGHAYKIHMIYNALAAPSNQNYGSVGDNPEAISFNWSISTKPVKTVGYKASPYMVVDTRKVTEPLLGALEEILYGTSLTAPRLPSPTELVALFTDWPSIYIVDNGDGTFTASGPDDQIRFANPHMFEFTGDTVINNGDGSFEISTA